MQKKYIIALSAAMLLLVSGAGIAAYMYKDTPTEQTATVKTSKVSWNHNDQAMAPPPPEPRMRSCDDGNVVGTALGGVGGALAGSAIGKGNGRTAATIGGALGGAYLGQRYIPTKNVTCAN